ncbi:MAG: TPM domain-containing protein [Rhodobacteraceae bacterium]|nr:TPM domain-containing protein [Paracoccaceae bacterium]
MSMTIARAAVLWVLAMIGTVMAEDLPPPPDGHLADFAAVLSDAEKTRLDIDLQALQSRTGASMMVVTLPDLASMPHAGSIRAFGRDLFNAWGVGAGDRNNGLMLLIAVSERETALVLGAAYGQGYDVTAQDILNRQVNPALASGQYASAIGVALPAIEERIIAHRDARAGTAGRTDKAADPKGNTIKYALGGMGAIVLLGIIMRRRRARIGDPRPTGGHDTQRRRDSDDDRQARRAAKDRPRDDAGPRGGGRSDGGGASGRF